MQGQQHIFTFLVIIIVLFMFNLCRNAIKNEKELRRIREEASIKMFESNLIRNEQSEKDKEMKQTLRQKHEKYLQKLFEQKDVCYDIHAIIFKPENIAKVNNENKNNHILEVQNEHKEKFDQGAERKSKNSVVTGPIVYMLVIILICSLVKAFTDMSSQLSKKSVEEDFDPRRCSLQEYAKREKRSSKAPFIRRATALTMDAHQNTKQKSLEERRVSHIIPEFNNDSGLITEPGTPAKTTNGIASRPAPLLRRCSVPAFALQQTGHSSILRRPSIDSFSEDDSSPDVKRRVRMIHRH